VLSGGAGGFVITGPHGVAVGVGVGLGDGGGVPVGLGVGVNVAVAVAVGVGVNVAVAVAVGVGVNVAVAVAVGVGAGLIVNVTGFVAVQPFLVALRITVYTPERVGVPVMFPLVVLTVKPGGKFVAPYVSALLGLIL
jgi:hypothetical protein